MDASTFETVFKSHYRLLCIHAYSMLGDDAAAKDLVQALFIDIWEKRTDLSIKKDVASYLWVSVRNRCLTYQRNKANYDRKVAEHEQEATPDTDEISLKMDGQDISDKLAAAISDMPERRSRIFQLVYLQGMAYQQAADQLSISKNSIKTQIKIGLQHLRLKLGGITWEQ